jgi:hypothetical protein
MYINSAAQRYPMVQALTAKWFYYTNTQVDGSGISVTATIAYIVDRRHI